MNCGQYEWLIPGIWIALLGLTVQVGIAVCLLYRIAAAIAKGSQAELAQKAGG